MDFLRNMFMFEADTGSGGSGSTADNNTADTNKDTSADSQNTDNTIPYDRFKKVNDEKNTFKTKYEELLTAQQQAEEDAKKKQGEFQSLYDELKPQYDTAAEELKQYKEVFQETLKARKESVPENMRDLIPQGSEIEQLNWIENAITKGLFKQGNPQSFGNEGNNPDNQDSSNNDTGFLKGLSRF